VLIGYIAHMEAITLPKWFYEADQIFYPALSFVMGLVVASENSCTSNTTLRVRTEVDDLGFLVTRNANSSACVLIPCVSRPTQILHQQHAASW